MFHGFSIFQVCSLLGVTHIDTNICYRASWGCDTI